MKFALRVVALLVVVLVAAGLVFYRYPLWVADQQIRFHLWREGVKSEYVEAGGYRLHYFEALPRAPVRDAAGSGAWLGHE